MWYWYVLSAWKRIAYWVFSVIGIALGIGGVAVALWPDMPDRWTLAWAMWLLGAGFWFGIRVSYWVNDRLGF